MASQLILDLKDEGVAKLVEGWSNGETYQLGGLTIKQVSNDGKFATFDVTDLPVDEMPAEDETKTPPTEGEMQAGGVKPPKKAMAGKPAIMIAFGEHK